MSQPFALPAELVVQSATELRGQLMKKLSAQRKQIELDGSAVELIDGAGLQLLLATQKEADHRQLSLRVLNPSPVLQRTLALTGLAQRLSAGVSA